MMWLLRPIALLLLLLAGHGAWAAPLPILFLHGDGASAAVWQTTIWRFESNGYPPELLHALDFSHPAARDANHVPQANRSGSDDQLAELAAEVDRILTASGQQQLILVGSSRGGYAIRNFIRHGGGGKVALAILCGTPNHGVFALPFRFDFEFNGMGPFLRDLNHPTETDRGVHFVTLRSDHNDKFAQPFGRYIGFPLIPTLVGSDGPALQGADNIVLPGLDHCEVAFHRRAFAALYQAITATKPQSLDPIPQSAPLLSGMISGYDHGAFTNQPLAGAVIEIYRIDPASGERQGPPAWQQTTAADGRWGPFTARPDAFYEFVVNHADYPTTHIYRSPFPRSTRWLHVRLEPLPAADGAQVTLSRPRGYLGKGRDTVLIDGKSADLPDGVPSVNKVMLGVPAEPKRPVAVSLNGESLTVRNWPASEQQRVIAEMHN